VMETILADIRRARPWTRARAWRARCPRASRRRKSSVPSPR